MLKIFLFSELPRYLFMLFPVLAGVASGATRAALTQHFALAKNAADISAKVVIFDRQNCTFRNMHLVSIKP